MSTERANELINSGMTRREMARRIAALEALHLPKLKRSNTDVSVKIGHIQCLENQLKEAVGAVESSLHWLEDFQKVTKEESRQEYEAQAEGRIDCHVINAPCDHFMYQCDSNGEVAISHCKHPDNVSEFEGNCTQALCPRYEH